ncbi:MAG: hypothetical protein ABI947_00885 [Chloroflexota bacterium]
MDNKGDRPRTLLRRLLKQADEQMPQAVELDKSLPESSSGAIRTTGDASPVRPASPDSAEPPSPIMPQPRATQNASAVPQPSGVEARLQAEEALEKLRQKTAQIANEFAEGKLNRAQFTAMYAHFNEKRVIIEQLLARDPDTQAWQHVARPGHTGFLRQHFEARVLSYSIYNNSADDMATPITTAGSITLPPEIIDPILTALSILLKTRTASKPLRALNRQLENGQWIAIIPGMFTSAIALFSLEPSSQQFTLVVDLQRDFERANRVVLGRGIRQPDQLVFPHRALFEQQEH